MSNRLPPKRLSFEENISSLLEELDLAGKWERPSLLLAIHKSKFGQEKAQNELAARLAKLGRDVIRLTVDEQHSDVPHLMAQSPSAARSVFFVSNLDWGGGADRKDAYRALNIYRELFIDNHIKAVFWLTPNEAATLARFAPDFWAFRHRVIEFTGERIPRLVKLPAGVLLWDVENVVDPYDTPEARIAVREDLLARLPHNNEARASRIDLLANLGYLYWCKGNVEEAAKRLQAGLELAGTQQGGMPRAALLNGLGILAYDAGRHDDALEHMQAALVANPDNALLLVNLAAALSAVGRNQDALAAIRRATAAGSRDPRVWTGVAYIQAATGKYDQAIASLRRAVELAPRTALPHMSLAVCYSLVERDAEARQELEQARTLAREGAADLLGLYEALLEGNMASAAQTARAALQAGRLLPQDLYRDAGLSLLMDRSQIDQLLVA